MDITVQYFKPKFNDTQIDMNCLRKNVVPIQKCNIFHANITKQSAEMSIF